MPPKKRAKCKAVAPPLDMTKTRLAWLCRERWPRRPVYNDYMVFYCHQPPICTKEPDGIITWSVSTANGVACELDVRLWHKLFPLLRLRPGGGPMRMRLTGWPVKEGPD
jgi:hypothetical protein